MRNPIHRMLGVATARIETAAGGKPEALLRVVSLEAAEELRRYTLGENYKAAETPEETTPPLQVPDREFVRLGLISLITESGWRRWQRIRQGQGVLGIVLGFRSWMLTWRRES